MALLKDLKEPVESREYRLKVLSLALSPRTVR